MKKLACRLFATAITAAILTQAPQAHAQSKDEQEIRALQSRLSAAVRATDIDAVMKEYVPGNELFVFDSNLPRQHKGWASYKDDWWSFLGTATDVKADVIDLGITTDGNLAFSHNLEHLAWTNKSDGSHDERIMSVTDAYRKIDGKWLIVMEHWSIPVQNGKAAFMAQP